MRITSNELSRQKKKISFLYRQRSVVEKGLLGSGALLTGSLIEQLRTCGRAGCRCGRGELHGPYHYLVTGKGRKRRLSYVSKKNYPQAAEGIEARKEFFLRILRLEELNREIRAAFAELGRMPSEL